MSLVDRLERALEKLAEGSASAVFGGRLDLVAVGQELFNVAARDSRLREAGAEAPNAYSVALELGDYGELVDEIERLQQQYRRAHWERLRETGYLLAGVPTVLITPSEGVAAGGFRIESSFTDPRLSFALTDVGPGGRTHRAEAPATIGRETDCDVCLPSASVSRKHAQMLWDGNHFRVVDLNSKNGTRVNGALVGAGPVEPGDAVEVGEIALRFDLS